MLSVVGLTENTETLTSLIEDSTVKAADGVINYYAVVCGIADYPGTINDLDYTDNDALDFVDKLKNSYNWDSSNINILLNSSATASNIESAISRMGDSADADDVCVFFFSGHGTNYTDMYPYDESDGVDEYICTYGGEICDDELSTWFDALPTSDYVVFLDTCHSGGQIRGLSETISESGDGLADDLINDLSAITPKDLNDNGCGVVLTACNDDEYSYETSYLQNGIFTYYLTESMSANGDTNYNGWISAEEAYAYLTPKTTAFESSQHPQIYDGHAGELNFLQITEGLPVVSIATNDSIAAEEGLDRGYFIISRTGQTTSSLTVYYTLSGTATNGTDYVTLSGSAVIPKGQTQTVISVVPIEDTELENDETVVLTLFSSSSYSLDNSSASVTITDNDYCNIEGTVWNDLDGDGNRDLDETGLADVTVYLDLNGNGQLDNFSGNFQSTSVPLPIADAATQTSTVLIKGAGTTLTDIDVTLDITHTYDSDLDVYLVSPSGTRVLLFSDIGSSGDNFTNTTLNDQTGISISSGSAPFSGSFSPEGSLATFTDENPNGLWTLEITDDSTGDKGTLNSWSLTITCLGEPIAITTKDDASTSSIDETGQYAFTGLTPGSYTVAEIVQEGWLQTSPGQSADGKWDIHLSGGETLSGLNFGNREEGLGYFEWNTFASTQAVGQAIPVTISKKDDLGNVDTTFDGTVEISGWAGANTTSTVVITEINLNSPDGIEIQNVSNQNIDTSGWMVVVNGSSYTDINQVNSTYWYLPTSMTAGEVLYRTDSTSDQYWGTNLYWDTDDPGWAMILNAQKNIVDFVAWEWTASDIADMAIDVDGTTITIGNKFLSDGVPTAGTGTIQRLGDSDSNTASDFVWASASQGTQNDGLNTPFAGGLNSVAISPTVTGNFVNGVWTGNIIVNEAVTDMYLRIDDGNGLTASSNTFTTASSLLAGDANGDGRVDGSDVTILASNWQVGVDDGQTATPSMGDFNGDGKVDGSDVTILAGNWQAGVSSEVVATSTTLESESEITDQNDWFIPPSTASLGIATVPVREQLQKRRIVTPAIASPVQQQSTDAIFAQSKWVTSEQAAIAKALAVATVHAKKTTTAAESLFASKTDFWAVF